MDLHTPDNLKWVILQFCQSNLKYQTAPQRPLLSFLLCSLWVLFTNELARGGTESHGVRGSTLAKEQTLVRVSIVISGSSSHLDKTQCKKKPHNSRYSMPNMGGHEMRNQSSNLTSNNTYWCILWQTCQKKQWLYNVWRNYNTARKNQVLVGN